MRITTVIIPADHAPQQVRFLDVSRQHYGVAFAVSLPFGHVLLLDVVTKPGIV